MQIPLADYTFDEIIHDSNRTIVYRATKNSQRQQVIVKVQKGELLRIEQIARFKQEYQILTQLDFSGVIKAYGLKKFQNKLALILEDFAGESLKDYIQNKKARAKRTFASCYTTCYSPRLYSST